MDLFEHAENKVRNLLPYGGVVHYYGPILSITEADNYYQKLLTEIDWQHDEAVIMGKHIVTKRKIAWHADQPFTYGYSNTTKTAQPWPPTLLQLKKLVEETTQETFNSCLLNLYHNGDEGMAWHSDAEKALRKNGTIGSLSFGAVRKFAFKHKKTKETIAQPLEHSGLLVMRGETQTNWLHSLPKTKLVTTPRINLTFRQIDVSRQK